MNIPIDIRTLVNSIKVHCARGLVNPELNQRIQTDFPGISFDEYNQAARIALTEMAAEIDNKIVVGFIKVHISRGLGGLELTRQIQSDFPNIPRKKYEDAFRAAQTEIIAGGVLQIRRDAGKRPMFSVWFVSDVFTSCEWEGAAHLDAVISAGIFQQYRYPGVRIVDRAAP